MPRLGTRRSRLAIKQVEEFTRLFPEVRFEIVYFDTSGDIDKSTPIRNVEGSDFFTDTINKALLDWVIDMALHSAKDMPDKLPRGLKVVFITDSIDPTDVLVSRIGLSLEELPPSSRIGTSSQRRKEELERYRQDFRIMDLRGNIDERLEKLDNGEYDAIIIAGCALKRLGLENRITQVLPFKTHPLQGCLAVVAREDDYEKGLFDWCRSGKG